MLTVLERINDISERSGMSQEIVRRVLKASKESLVYTLQKGEKSTLPGIATYKVAAKKDGVGVRFRISTTILTELTDYKEEQKEETDKYIDIEQIPGLM